MDFALSFIAYNAVSMIVMTHPELYFPILKYILEFIDEREVYI